MSVSTPTTAISGSVLYVDGYIHGHVHGYVHHCTGLIIKDQFHQRRLS